MESNAGEPMLLEGDLIGKKWVYLKRYGLFKSKNVGTTDMAMFWCTKSISWCT